MKILNYLTPKSRSGGTWPAEPLPPQHQSPPDQQVSVSKRLEGKTNQDIH